MPREPQGEIGAHMKTPRGHWLPVGPVRAQQLALEVLGSGGFFQREFDGIEYGGERYVIRLRDSAGYRVDLEGARGALAALAARGLLTCKDFGTPPMLESWLPNHSGTTHQWKLKSE